MEQARGWSLSYPSVRPPGQAQVKCPARHRASSLQEGLRAWLGECLMPSTCHASVTDYSGPQGLRRKRFGALFTSQEGGSGGNVICSTMYVVACVATSTGSAGQREGEQHVSLTQISLILHKRITHNEKPTMTLKRTTTV